MYEFLFFYILTNTILGFVWLSTVANVIDVKGYFFIVLFCISLITHDLSIFVSVFIGTQIASSVNSIFIFFAYVSSEVFHFYLL